MNSSIPVTTIFPCRNSTGAGVTKTVGNVPIPEISKVGAGVDVVSVADIASPSSWTELISIPGKQKIVWGTHSTVGTHFFIHISVDTVEDAGDAIRLQILRDGIIAWDNTVTRYASAAAEQFLEKEDLDTMEENCNLSFVVRACKKGTMAGSASVLRVGSMTYSTLE